MASSGTLLTAAQSTGQSTRWRSQEGSPNPLGLCWIPEEQAYNFALYSKYASRVTLLLYTPDDLATPVLTVPFDPLQNKSGRVWHYRLPESDMRNARYYAYSIDGPLPNGRFEWHHFDPQKVLLDPYARTVIFPDGFDRFACSRPGSTAGRAPLGLICKDRDGQTDGIYDWGNDRSPRHEADAIIYELHVRGFTMHPASGVPLAKQGTFAGLIEKIPYLKDLGVTIVELMPIFQCDPQEGSVWGYMPLNFFSPHHNLASTTDPERIRNEFRDMVKAFHAADIEVILDVVYNHTCENDSQGPNYSYKGIDNSTYYMISETPQTEPYANFAGTGNTLHCANHAVRKLILDSMRYWVKEMHVDGFRFDLASVLSRNSDGSINTDNPPIFSEIASDPELANIRLIAEPWDAGGGYLLGVNKLQQAFPGISWLQWNDQFRMDAQRFVKSDPDCIARLMTRLYGSDDLFPDTPFYAYHPYQSVNYVNSHDGFSLYDQVAYNNKVNLFDGASPTLSWNCGWEGDTNVPPDVMNLRRKQAKNLATLVFLANGTPMFRAGDEFLHTQNGHNNPYNIDELNWLDWSRLQSNADHFRFFKQLIAFRKAHPSLCRSRFWREDVRWYGAGGDADLSYESRSLAFHLKGARVNDVDLYVMINAWWEPLRFSIQSSGSWKRIIDTNLPSPDDIVEAERRSILNTNTYEVAPRSIVVLESAI